MTKALIFDADGVLINSEMFSVYLMRNYGISSEITLPFFTGEFRDCIIGKLDLKEVLPKHLKKWGFPKSVDDFLNEWFLFEHKIDLELVDFIKKARNQGIKCYLSTNQEKYRTKYMLNDMGFSKIFDNIFSSSSLGYRKPNVEFFERMMKDIKNINIDEILFWDNTEKNVEGAKKFGFHAELYINFQDFAKKMGKYKLT